MQKFTLTGTCELIVMEGDITRVHVDAIVNAANPRMLGGGGVDGAIHRAAGPELEEACRLVPEVQPGVRCPRGEARLTPAFNLPARFVIHTVGPVYESKESSAPVLEAAYRSVLELANQHSVASLAFPAISCGVYGYPVEEAGEIAIQTCRECVGSLREIRFVLFGRGSFEIWRAVATRLLT